jgi:hypothetical protein
MQQGRCKVRLMLHQPRRASNGEVALQLAGTIYARVFDIIAMRSGAKGTKQKAQNYRLT